MKTVAAYIILTIALSAFYKDVLFLQEAVTFAAVSGDNLSAYTSDTVGAERVKAREEYEIYKQRKEAQRIEFKKRVVNRSRVAQPLKGEPVSPARDNNDVMVGAVLILAAAVLVIYAHQISKRSQGKNGAIHKETKEG